MADKKVNHRAGLGVCQICRRKRPLVKHGKCASCREVFERRATFRDRARQGKSLLSGFAANGR
jgi:hypothetical protein